MQQTPLQENAAAMTIAGKRYLTPAALRQLFPYKNKTDFWTFIRASGMPVIRLNARRIVFDETDVAAWLESRRIVRGTGKESAE